MMQWRIDGNAGQNNLLFLHNIGVIDEAVKFMSNAGRHGGVRFADITERSQVLHRHWFQIFYKNRLVPV